jgi:hypothetical protein
MHYPTSRGCERKRKTRDKLKKRILKRWVRDGHAGDDDSIFALLNAKLHYKILGGEGAGGEMDFEIALVEMPK